MRRRHAQVPPSPTPPGREAIIAEAAATAAVVASTRDEVGPARSAPGLLWTDGLGRAAIRCLQLILVGAAIAVGLAVAVRLRLVVVPVVIAGMLAAAVWPMVGWLRRQGTPHALAAWAAVLTGATVLGLLGCLVVAGIKGQWNDLRDRAAEGVREVEKLLASGALPIDAQRIEAARDSVVAALTGQGARAQAATGALLAVEVITGLVLAVVVLLFLLKDGPKIWRFLHRGVPAQHRERSQRIGDRCVDVLGAYVRGTTVIALVDAVVIGVALALLGVPLALPLAVLIFLGAYIPLLGAVVTGALAALVALVTNGPVTALIVLAIVIAVNQLEGDLLAPLVLGRALSLHPLVVLLGLTTGTILAGVIGALLAVPAIAIAWTVITAWNDHSDTPPAAGPADSTSVCPPARTPPH